MKFLLLISLLLVVLLLPNAFAQIEFESSRDVYIFVQTFVRNSDGQLVHYFENDKFTHKYFEDLHPFLDFEASRGNDPIYDVNGKKFQLIQRASTNTSDEHQLVTSTLLSSSEHTSRDFIIRYAHDGYFLVPGDEVTQVWTFLRTIN